MKRLFTLAVAAALSTPVLAADYVLTKKKHTDAMSFGPQETPAVDSTEVTWIAKDMMRSDEGDKSTIIRLDLKKMYVVDHKAKTVSTIDMPMDMKKYFPPEMAPMIEQVLSSMKVTVTPSTETKKIQTWNTTKYTMTLSMMMGGITQEMWTTKDIQLAGTGWNEMTTAMLSMRMGGEAMAAEMKKVEGVPVLVERVQKVGPGEVKSREEIVSVEQKEPAKGWYELPKDYVEKPFDPMAENGMGGGGSAGRPGKPGGKAPAPPDKPAPK